MNKTIKWLLIVGALIVWGLTDFASTLRTCQQEQQEKAQQDPEKGCGFADSLTAGIIKDTAEWIDTRHDFVTAAASIVVAFFTFTLWRATDRLWRAGERQMELISQNAADQSSDTRASIAEAARSAAAMEEVAKHIAVSAKAAQDSVAAVKDRTAAQMRAYLSVIIGGATYQEREKTTRFEAKPVIINNGFTPAYKVRYRAKAAIRTTPFPADFDYRLPPRIEEGGGVIGSQQTFIVSAIIDDYVPDEDVGDIKVGKKASLHVWGLVEYDDIFGDHHETEFSQNLIWLPNGNIYGWLHAAYGNAT